MKNFNAWWMSCAQRIRGDESQERREFFIFLCVPAIQIYGRGAKKSRPEYSRPALLPSMRSV
jgi:hypothetical protein